MARTDDVNAGAAVDDGRGGSAVEPASPSRPTTFVAPGDDDVPDHPPSPGSEPSDHARRSASPARASSGAADGGIEHGGGRGDVGGQSAKPSPQAQPSQGGPHSASIPSPSDSSPATTDDPKDGSDAHQETAPPPASQKPKSSRAPKRSPSPSPPPAPPPPELKTIRLEIKLGGPDNYAVDISALAKATGQRAATPPPVKRDTSDSEGDDEGDGKLPEGESHEKKGKKHRKKNLATEYYDLNDPFIDDSDLAVDERTFFAQTKQQGFYVSSGEVALLKDKTPKKPKSKKQIIPTIIPLAGSQALNTSKYHESVSGAPPNTQHAHREGSRESPIALLSDLEEGGKLHPNGLKRKSSADSQNTNGAKKKRKTIEIESFHPDLQVVLQELKAAIAKESFEQKGKFPPSLKPILAHVAVKAIQCGEYDDNFFSLMPKLFIYNKFTMTKLIKRTVYHDHQALLGQRQMELLEDLHKVAHDGFERAQEEYEKNVQLWERRQERAKADAPAGTSAEGTPVPGSVNATPLVNANNLALPQATNTDGADDGDGMDGDKEHGQLTGGAGRDAHKPGKRYRLTDPMKSIIWELVVLSNESCRIENEKYTLENSTVQVSEQGTRKQLYQKIVAAFPEGWMTSGQISREVSVLKKRYEAQQQEE